MDLRKLKWIIEGKKKKVTKVTDRSSEVDWDSFKNKEKVE
jgi:hypothetical protein